MVEILASDGEVSVQSNEFTIVNDSLYASSNVEHTPEWLLALIDNEVAKSIAQGFRDYDVLVQSVINAVSSLEEAEASYVTLTGFDTLVNGIVADRLEALTAQYDEVYASKSEVTNLIATSEQASAQSISDLAVSIDEDTNAKISNVQTAIVNATSAIAEDIDAISTTLNGNTAVVNQISESIDGIEASWVVETDVNGHVAGIKLVNSVDEPSKFIINTDVFEVTDATTGNTIIGTVNNEVVVDATNLNGIPATQVLADLGSLVVDFNEQNNRDDSTIEDPSSVVLHHTTMDNGSVDLTVTWEWSGSEASIDGFAINMYASSSEGTYLWGSSLSSETIFQVRAGKRSNTFSGLPSNLYYSFQILAYRKVDADVDSDGTIVSGWVSPAASQNPYQPEASMVITADVAGTVGGTAVSTLLGDLEGLATDFNSQNNRDDSAIVNPTTLSDGTTVDHTLNSDGSSDISFEWGWAGEEADIDGFAVLHYQTTSSSVHTFGTSPKLEISYIMPASARSFILRGVAANRFHSFGVTAYRSVDKNIHPNGVITSDTVTPSLGSEYPYRPSSNVNFSGNVTGTIDGYSSGNVVSNAYSGATFTSSTAGDLAYIDRVTTTYIDDLAVNRLKIQDEAVSIVRFAERNDLVFGNGNLVNVLSVQVDTPEVSRCIVQLSVQQGYNLAGTGDKGTTLVLLNGSSILQYRPMGVINDTPCIVVGLFIPAGSTTFNVAWKGESSDVFLSSRNLTIDVSLR